MGCCCKKKSQSGISIQLMEEEKIEKFNVEKATEVLEMCILADNKFKFLYDEIQYFTDNQIENLFYGNQEFFENLFMENKKYFNLLLIKIQDFQSIFNSWYKDSSKYGYIKNLWLKNLCVYKLLEKSEDELDDLLNEIYQDEYFQSNPNLEDSTS